MDESLASEEEEVDEGSEEQREEEQSEETTETEGDGQIENLNRAMAGLRRELKILREENRTMRDELRTKKETTEEEEEVEDAAGYYTKGEIHKLIRDSLKAVPKNNEAINAVRTEIINASEDRAREKYPDFDEVFEAIRDDLDDPVLAHYITGTPGQWFGAAERAYRYGLTKLGRSKADPNRKRTLESIVTQKKKPATMGVQSKKSAVQTGDPRKMSLDEMREMKKTNPAGYRKMIGDG